MNKNADGCSSQTEDKLTRVTSPEAGGGYSFEKPAAGPTVNVGCCGREATKLESLVAHRERAAEEYQRLNGLTKEESARLFAIQENKALRRDFDDALQRLKNSTRKSPERSTAIRKITEGIMWLGMDLKDLGNGPNPYPNSKDPSNTIVEQTADGLKL